MSIIYTVFKKELIDTLRDKRTLISAIIMPALMLPVLFWGIGKLSQFILEKETNKKIKIALISAPQEFISTLDTAKIEVVDGYTIETAQERILIDSLDALIGFTDSFRADQENLVSSDVNMWYKSTNLMVLSRMTGFLSAYEKTLLDNRITTLNISSKSIDPLQIKNNDIAPAKEQFGKKVGGFLPYLFIIFCFTGCMYPSLDLITGEKERGTIETLLTVPASRFKILLGKVLTIALMGLAAALMGILGLVIAGTLLPDMPDQLNTALENIISLKFILMLILMLVPLCFFMAGMLSAMVIKAKTFKEAQSIVSPFMGVIIVPAALALLPGIELNWKTALIPVLNIALATKEILSGTIQSGHYIAIVLSLVVLAILSVALSYRQFSKEGMVI